MEMRCIVKFIFKPSGLALKRCTFKKQRENCVPLFILYENVHVKRKKNNNYYFPSLYYNKFQHMVSFPEYGNVILTNFGPL